MTNSGINISQTDNIVSFCEGIHTYLFPEGILNSLFPEGPKALKELFKIPEGKNVYS